MSFESRKGASVTELGLLAGLIAVILILSISTIGDRVNKLFAVIGNQVNNVATGAPLVAGNPAPYITNISATGGVYYDGVLGRSAISFEVTFSEDVIITGAPSLPLIIDAGSGGQEAIISSGSGTLFIANYSVDALDRDYNGIDLQGSLSLNGGAIKDGDGKALTKTSGLPSLVTDTPIEIHFNPDKISGLAAWWDGADSLGMSLSGSSVNSWSSKVGGNTLSQSTAARKPILIENAVSGRSAVSFDSANKQFLSKSGGVLSGGDDTYSYVAVWRAKRKATMVVVEQNTSSYEANRRGCLITNVSGYGFNGQSNDYHDIIPYGPGTVIKTIMRVDANAGSSAIKIRSNGANYTGTTSAGASNLNLGASQFAMGRKITADAEYFDGEIAEILVFSNTLSDADAAEIEAYLNAKW